MNDVNLNYVVVREGRSYSLNTLTKATNLVLAGTKLIGANSDVSGPIENGIAPACRALVAPIEMATVLVLSGVSTMETLNTYAYRPTVVLSGVGEIVERAHAAK